MFKFRDEKSREWNLRINVPVMYKVCEKHGIGMQDMTKKNAAGETIINITLPQLLDLAWEGIQDDPRVQVGDVTWEDFENSFEGPSFMDCQKVTILAIADFFQRINPPKAKKPDLKEIEKETESEKPESSGGDGKPSISSPQEPV